MSHTSVTVMPGADVLPAGRLSDVSGFVPRARMELSDGVILALARGVEGVPYLRELAAVATRLADQLEEQT